ncbi:xanthine dehydrogenase accessory protein XdhC [Telluria aromaticivorans]|uniref:Xanthine dehydrogenase accessory protein XdhC n=1 Tax=Telluria aromaticivorans TaxID=2725995 RepID=A0A7Y2P1L3_9BURK|nr:xanthine dehydrogenase accessory protein XdhC [Telluria aromaticivorans]NNG25359.1 xanthine dehydrogenase accessory protein XdhC [Telluria aromaticivorans]
MEDWLTSTLGAPAVLVTVARVEGSVPREPGARMLVEAECFRGTIGGGHLEHRALEIARGMLLTGGEAHIERFPLGPSLGQCCGGIAYLAFEMADAEQLALLDKRRNEDTWRVVFVGWAASPPARSTHARTPDPTATEPQLVERAGGRPAHPTGLFDGSGRQLAGGEVPEFDRGQGTHLFEAGDGGRWLIDAVLAPRAHLMLFGAGHVGAAIVRALAELPCRVTWVDERDDLFPAAIPANVTVEATDTPEALVENAPQGTSFLVMTHSHALDLRLSHAILSRPLVARPGPLSTYGWFGLIGSDTKRRQFEHRLRERGVDAGRLDAMVCPVGLSGIEGKAPAVIAASVAAQLLTVWEAAARQPDVSSEVN